MDALRDGASCSGESGEGRDIGSVAGLVKASHALFSYLSSGLRRGPGAGVRSSRYDLDARDDSAVSFKFGGLPAALLVVAGLVPVMWRQLIASPDQLRQRVRMALLDILVADIDGVNAN